MPGRVEGVVNGRVCGEEPLSGSLGLEPLLLPLSFADGQMGVFGPIILSLFAVVMDVGKAQFGEGCTTRFETVGDDGAGPLGLVAQQPFEQLQRRCCQGKATIRQKGEKVS